MKYASNCPTPGHRTPWKAVARKKHESIHVSFGSHCAARSTARARKEPIVSKYFPRYSPHDSSALFAHKVQCRQRSKLDIRFHDPPRTGLMGLIFRTQHSAPRTCPSRDAKIAALFSLTSASLPPLTSSIRITTHVTSCDHHVEHIRHHR